MRLLLALLTCLVQSTIGFYDLKQLSYTQLATSERNGVYSYAINGGTATAAAYDPVNKMMYVIGEVSHFMHVLDITDPSNPTLELVHKFTKGEGIPMSIDVCDDDVAVALGAQTTGYEGHVRIYKTYKKGDTAMALNGYITVGNFPKSLKYTSSCDMVIANEGGPGKDETGVYVNPEGTVSIVHGEKTGNPSVRLVDFKTIDLSNVRMPSRYIPANVLDPKPLFEQDIEPDDVTISADGRTAWVTLQENDAIAEINLQTAVVNKVTPLPQKLWWNSPIDASNSDGGVHRRTYVGLNSLRQPGVIKSFQIGNKKFLVTGDEGAPTSYTNTLHGFTWTDVTTGYAQRGNIDPSKPYLAANASDNEFLGKLQISSIDGIDRMFTGKFVNLTAFGGRGFSIWDSSNLAQPVYDSNGTLEEYMEAYDKQVFNTDYLRGQSPETNRDYTSYQQGAQVTGLDIKIDNGTLFLVVGTWGTGTLFLYTVDTSTGQPVPTLNKVVRSGVTDLLWADLYEAKETGDLHISDLGIIESSKSPTGSPLVYVTGAGSGSLSLYSLEKGTSGIIPDPIVPAN